MTKRLIVSLATVSIALAGIVGATVAYFSDGKVLGSNTFQTGNVKLGEFNVAHLNVTGLAPGATVTVPNVGVNYIGDLNADIYLGVRGTTGLSDKKYIADHLYVRIYYVGTSAVAWEGWASQLSTVWEKIASNTTAGWKAYDITFTLASDTPNFHQGITNDDTELLFYAVQTGYPAPTTQPYLTTGTEWL